MAYALLMPMLFIPYKKIHIQNLMYETGGGLDPCAKIHYSTLSGSLANPKLTHTHTPNERQFKLQVARAKPASAMSDSSRPEKDDLFRLFMPARLHFMMQDVTIVFKTASVLRAFQYQLGQFGFFRPASF